jgi:hypothetical protein
MRSWAIVSILAILGLSTTIPSVAIGPQLKVDCGNWSLGRDVEGSYRELSALALYDFSGDRFEYRAKFYGSTKEKFSRGTFQGTYLIENPESNSHSVEFPLNIKFRKNKYELFMYKTKYIKAEIQFIDIQGFKASKTCIWKFK